MIRLRYKKIKRTKLSKFISVLSFLLILTFIIYFFYIQADIDKMEKELSDVSNTVIYESLKNNDYKLTLQDQQKLLERLAREKLDYAHPEERVFVDISGIK